MSDGPIPDPDFREIERKLWSQLEELEERIRKLERAEKLSHGEYFMRRTWIV